MSKQHTFRSGENIADIAKQNRFILVETIWNDPGNAALRALRGSPYSLRDGDVLVIPDFETKKEPGETGRRHRFVIPLRPLPAFYLRLDPAAATKTGAIGPVYAATGATRIDISFLPHIGGALAHVKNTGGTFRSVIAGRGEALEPARLASCSQLLAGEKAAWVADAVARHGIEDVQMLLTWTANALSLPCDPEGIDGDFGPRSGLALQRLRAITNYRKKAGLVANRERRPEEDFGVFFDALEEHIAKEAQVDPTALGELRKRAVLVEPRHVDFDDPDPIGQSAGAKNGLDVVLVEEQAYDVVAASFHSELVAAGRFSFARVAAAPKIDDFAIPELDVLDIEDIHFATDRFILMPIETETAPPTETWGLGGLDVVAAALKHAREHISRSLLVTGHTDAKGDKKSNLTLSAKRANGAFFVLGGYAYEKEWLDLSANSYNAEELRTILRWIDSTFAYGCAPSAPGEPNAAEDAAAVKAFVKRYNADVDELAKGDNPWKPGFEKRIPPETPPRRETWRGFFEMYQRYLIFRLGLGDQAALTKIQDGVKLVSPPTQGCGEHQTLDLPERARRRLALFPDETGPERAGDRRVEVIFFDPDELVDFPCHPTTDVQACKPELCQLYDEKLWKFRRLTLDDKPRPKIEIVRRMVFRYEVEDAEERIPQGWLEEGDFSPMLDEKADFEFRLTGLDTPFQGTLEVVLSRRSSVSGKPQRVAVVTAELNTDDPTLPVRVEWDGKLTVDAARQLSDLEIFDLNTATTVNAPAREMKSGEHVRRGVYVIEQVSVIEKDNVAAATLRPEIDVQDRFALVVPLVLEVDFDGEFREPLFELGFGRSSARVPYYSEFIEGIRKAIASYFRDVGIRFIYHFGALETNALPIRFVDDDSAVTPTALEGYSDVKVAGAGVALGTNLFIWEDRTKNKNAPKALVVIRLIGLFLRNNDSSPADRDTFRMVFGPLGVKDEKRWQLGYYDENKLEMHADVLPGTFTNRPRTLDDDEVTGIVTRTDEANTTVTLGGDGLPTVVSTNEEIVPLDRARDIQRAMRAIIGYLGAITAHEIGHLVGAASTLLGTPDTITVDGATVTAPHNQDVGGHDTTFTPHGIMVSGEKRRLTQLFRLAGPKLRFNNDQQAYLNIMLPRAAALASQWDE